MEYQSVWQFLNGALGTMWVLLASSVLVMAVTLERVMVQWKFMDRARTLAETVSRCLTRGAVDEGRSACERSRSPLADVFLVGYERLGRVKPENVNSAVHRERVRVLAGLKGWIWILGTIGATAPFIGLLGTVVGILSGFGDLEDADQRGEAGIGVVSGHISEALVATAAGILVAVVAVFVFNYFNQKVGRISLESKMLTDEFLEQLHEFAGPNKAAPDEAKGGSDGDRQAA